MQKLYSCRQASELEKLAKEKYAVPEFLMMENAAKAMADFITNSEIQKKSTDSPVRKKLVIVCGKGNNGGDGYALARLLQNRLEVIVAGLEEPSSEEAIAQYEMCKRLDVNTISFAENFDTAYKKLEQNCKVLSPDDFIVDCIYGTGFHGELSNEVAKILDLLNASRAIKIACDIPSALAFNADYTITMGEQKLILFSDKAKNVCGNIITADLGIAREKLQDQEGEAYLVDYSDVVLPLRKNRAAHKGSYGQTSVLCGDKAGAAILAATAAMNFGSGLTTIIENAEASLPLSQFKISPSLMISETIPKKTTCISVGSGFSEFSEIAAEKLVTWFKNCKNPAAVLDAGMLTSPLTPELLARLNSFENSRIILTPHLAELNRLLQNVAAVNPKAASDFCISEDKLTVSNLADLPEIKIAAGKLLNHLYPNTAVIMKSANTFIACNGKIYIVADGAQSLAKGGSGDILAGMAAALLAQGYSLKSAVITATEQHAHMAQITGSTSYNLTPEKLLEILVQS